MQKISLSTILKLFFAVCAFSLSSCQEYGIDSQADFPPKLETDAQSEYTVSAKFPKDIVFNISSNTPWKIESDQNWCIPTPSLSSASSLIAEIKINVEENPDEQDRTATLTISTIDAGTIAPVKITIQQDAKGKLAVQPVDDPIETQGGTATFIVSSNRAWTAASSNQWLTLSKNSGEGSTEVQTITVTATANTGLRRKATVTVNNGLDEFTFDVIQKGIILEFDNPDGTPFSGDNDQESKTFAVSAIGLSDWAVSTDVLWLDVQKSADGNSVTATTKSEIYFTNRSAHIILEATDKSLGLEPVTLEVQQTGGTNIAYDPTATHTIDEATGALTLSESTGNSNCRFYVDKSRHLAIHEWHFSNIWVDNNRCLNMNCVNPPSPSWNFWLGVGANNWTFKYRGGTANDNFTCTPFELNDMKALKVEHNYSTPGDETKAKITVYIMLGDATEWTKIIETNDYPTFAADQSNLPYFGFIGGSAGKAASMTITSYEVTNIE